MTIYDEEFSIRAIIKGNRAWNSAPAHADCRSDSCIHYSSNNCESSPPEYPPENASLFCRAYKLILKSSDDNMCICSRRRNCA
ncbi:hypothetical protein Y032_0249g121 [Ancylostoma ceylanicum]|uniref:Uncharacterized protein n=1 Tax=Ancylostoma ceylanicum TaxID=53326 RepID=A0A016SDE1_9BILA|nr:hypothetical protein Y032_0249g121 [Ancylostoma ceylanicum]